MSNLPLRDPSLLREALLINGQWVQADNGATFDVLNPATGRPIAKVPDAGRAETSRAIDAADRALIAWRARLSRDRAAILRRFYELVLQNIEDLCVIITSEQGKPLAESRAEILYAAGFIEWYSEEARRAYGEIIPQNVPGRRILVQKAPVGVFAAITPWNFPAAMITRKVGPGWAAGCTAVIKPAEQTPLTALALGVLAERAGLPAGVCNIVTGDAKEIGAEITESPIVRKLSFTGSTEVGSLLLAQCARTVKRTSMELGGNAPFLVFEDADLDAAVEGAIKAKYRNAGQACIAANRFIVHSSLSEVFAERLAEASRRLRVGNGMDRYVEMGPLINTEAVSKVESHVQDAVRRGARLVTGGGRHALGGCFFQPTVISNVSRHSLTFQNEVFGPVAPIFSFESETEAIELANDTSYGLAAYAYSRDVGRIFRVVEALDFGMVGVNEGIISTEVAPFGGMKQSGHGREGSHHGMDEYMEIKYVALGGLQS